MSDNLSVCVRIVALSAAAASLAAWADTAFPSAGGDLASAAAWGGAFPTDRALIDKGGDYVVSDDVTLNGFYIDIGKNNNATFTVAAGKTVTLGAGFNLYAEQGYNDILLKGGTWDLTSHSFFPQNGWNSNNRNHYNLTLDGVIVTNVDGLVSMGYYGASGHNVFALTNGASLTTSGTFELSYDGQGDNALYVTAGSRLTCGSFKTTRNASNHASSRVVVDGAGSVLKTTASASQIGYANGHSVTVRNGASLLLNSGYWYFGGGKANNVILLDGTKEARFSAMYVTGSNNVIRSVNGSTVRFGDRVYAQNWSYDCGFDIVDSTNTFTAIFTDNAAGKNGATNLFFRLSGPAAQASFSNEGSYLYRTRLIFDLPIDGYPADHVPMISTQNYYMDGTTSLEIENLADIQSAIRAAGGAKRTWRLITTTGSFNGINAAVTAANAKYAGNAVFEVSGKNVDVTVYGGEPSTLTIASAKGTPDPAVGAHIIPYGESVTATVAASVFSGANNATRYDLVGWTGTGSVPATGSGNEVTFTQTEDSSLTWNWSETAQQKLLFGGTLEWPSAETEKYTDATENWISNGTLSQSAVWSDDEQLAAGRLRILAGGTYTVDRDVTLAGVDFSAKAEPVVFDATGRNLNLSGSINFHTKSVVTLKGGHYEMNGSSFMPQNDWSCNRRREMNLVFDGTVVTNAGNFVLGYYSTTGENTLSFTNNAVYHQAAGSTTCWICNQGVGQNLLHVSAGSRFVVPGGIKFHHNGSGAASGSKILVDGTGSLVKTGGGCYMTGEIGSTYIARNGGTLSLGGWWDVGESSFIGIENTSCTNYLGSPYFKHSNARFCFTNATVSISSLYGTAGAAASNNWIEVCDSDLFIDCNAKVNNNETGNNVMYRISGTHPRIQHGKTGGSPGGANFRPNGRFLYDLPPAGYDLDDNNQPIVPLDIQNWGQMDSTVRFEIANVEAVKAAIKAEFKTRRTWKLAKFRNFSDVGLAVDASNEVAPEGVEFSLTSGGVSVTVTTPCGAMIIFR